MPRILAASIVIVAQRLVERQAVGGGHAASNSTTRVLGT